MLFLLYVIAASLQLRAVQFRADVCQQNAPLYMALVVISIIYFLLFGSLFSPKKYSDITLASQVLNGDDLRSVHFSNKR